MAVETKKHFTRALRLAYYNRPLYVAAFLGALIGAIIASTLSLPPAVRVVGGIGAIASVWFGAASFLAFHWMFDRSGLLDGRWVLSDIAAAPKRWVQVSVCLEETTLPLESLFPDTEGKQLDLYHPELMTEPAVTRARQSVASSGITPADPEHLPVADGWADLVVVMLAAHEVRDWQQRERLFLELRRIVAEPGRVIVVEHLRNLAALLAFGPGLTHFYSHNEWTRLAAMSGLKVVREHSITPFVSVFVLEAEKSPQDSQIDSLVHSNPLPATR